MPKHNSPVIRARDGMTFNTMGALVKRLVHPETVGSQNLGLSVVFMNPGEEFRQHRHPPEEAYYVIQGKGVLYLEGHGEIPLEPHVCVYIPSMAKHGQKNTGDEPLVIIAALSPALTTTPIED